MDDDEFRIIKEGILLIEQQEYDENNNIERYYQEKRVSLVSEEGCIILYYSDAKNKSFETAQFVSILGCKLLVCEDFNFEIVLSPNFSIKFQSTTNDDKKQWIDALEVHTVKVQTNNNSDNNTSPIHKLRLGGGVSLPELKITDGNGAHHRNFNLSAPGQVQESQEDEKKTRPINNTNVTPRIPQRRDLTEDEKQIVGMFPNMEVEIILDALEFCGGDRDEVISLLSTQTRLSFQDLNSYSPLGKSLASRNGTATQQQFSSSYIIQRKNIERELEELERELEEYDTDDEDSIDGDLERELIENSKDDPQMASFLAKYCNTSYVSSDSESQSSSFNNNSFNSQTQFQKIRVKSSRLKQIEEYYQNSNNNSNNSKNSNFSESSSNFTESPPYQQQQTTVPPYQKKIPPTPTIPDINISSTSSSSSSSDSHDINNFNEKLNVNNQINNRNNNQSQQCNNNNTNCNINNNSNINNNNKNNNEIEKENNRVHLIIRKKSISPNVNSSFNGGHNNSLQWSYRAPSSLSNQLSEPIGLRSSNDRSSPNNNTANNNNNNSFNNSHYQIILTPPSSPTITPPISPTLLASQSPSSTSIWKPSLKSGMAWDLSISVMGFLKLKDHIEYRIHVITRHSEWIVYRRYNNFFLLHKKLRNMGVFKNTYVKLPPKQLRGTSYQVAKSRQMALQNYLTTLLSTFKGLFYNNSCVNVFLNSDVDSEVFQQFMIQQFDQQQPPSTNKVITENSNSLSEDDHIEQQPISLSASTPSPLSTNRVTLQTTSHSFIK